ncbi:hypothetical protein GCM10007940_19270 [Portibacter lacus]|uniref:Uncharacterized protein n=1 Tax=Portibacter lacus TaxID=1099794 RepID=A0AA37SNW5_9BACT|nr:hypothetical protein GCM10007940_19270 [Portibacter lacus]
MITNAQNVGINLANPVERFHIQDNSNTKLLLRTSSGTSFFTADAPTNSGLLFRSGGTDRASMFYSPLSNSLSASIGLNGWTMSANGDFRVKERVYSLNDLRLDATESVTIEANGAMIKIDTDGNIQIIGKNISIEAEENLNISAANINIEAEQTLQVVSGGESSYAAGSSMDFGALNDVNLLSGGDFNVQSDNVDLVATKATNINSGNGLAITSSDLAINTSTNAIFSIGNGLAINTGQDFNITVNNNFALNVAQNYNLNISQNYALTALNICAQASATMNILGNLIRFNNGSTGFAMKGDAVEVGGKVGTITSGSTTILGN